MGFFWNTSEFFLGPLLRASLRIPGPFWADSCGFFWDPRFFFFWDPVAFSGTPGAFSEDPWCPSAGPPSAGPHSTGPPKISRFFPSPAANSTFSSLCGGSSRGIVVAIQCRGPLEEPVYEPTSPPLPCRARCPVNSRGVQISSRRRLGIIQVPSDSQGV